MICEKCGKQIDDLAMVCPYCGGRVESKAIDLSSSSLIKTKKCYKCGREVAKNSTVCPYCKRNLLYGGSDASGWWVVFGLFVPFWVSLIMTGKMKKTYTRIVAKLRTGVLLQGIIYFLSIIIECIIKTL